MNSLLRSGRLISNAKQLNLNRNIRKYSTDVGVKQKTNSKAINHSKANDESERLVRHRPSNNAPRVLNRNNLFSPFGFDPFSSVFSSDPFRSPFFSSLERPFKGFDNPMFREAESQISDVRVNLYSNKEGWTVEAELAGIPKEDVQVEIEDNMITIKGERKLKDEEEEGKVYSRKESFHGSFSRSFELPEAADPSKVKANFQDGILKIVIGKKEGMEEKVKKITIE